MRIAIVDDIESERKELHKKVSIMILRYSLNAQIFEYKSGKEFLDEAQCECI